MNTVFPDYENSILSAASSLLHHYGAAADHSGLAAVDQALSLPCKNKIMIILDGIGSEFLRRKLPQDCFLRRHFRSNRSSEEVFASGLFGPGTLHRKIDDFVGDYLACATGQTILRYRSLFNRPRTPFKGHHAGLCVEEMMVPLIISHK